LVLQHSLQGLSSFLWQLSAAAAASWVCCLLLLMDQALSLIAVFTLGHITQAAL